MNASLGKKVEFAGASQAARPDFRRVPGLPVVGVLPAYARDPLAFMVRMRNTADLVESSVGGTKMYFVNHPALIEEVLVTHNASFIKDRQLREGGRPVFGNGLLTSHGDFWLRQRRLASPAFHRQRIATYAGIMVSHTHGMLAQWRDGETRDVHHDMMQLTLGVVARCLFNTNATEQAREIGQALDRIMNKWDNQGLVQMIESLINRPLDARKQRAYLAAIDALDRIIHGIIAERRKTNEDVGDLLSMFLAARDDDGAGMSDAQLRDECMTMFLAGHETTALALSWTWLELSRNPAAAKRLREEIDRELGGRAPSLEDLARLPYTNNVISESMRLHPPAWAIAREAIEDVTIGGQTIARGSELYISQYAMHRDPRYFAEPERFLPERWEGDFAKRIPKYAYFPFGGGPRLCIGQQFAHMEAVLMLTTIAQRYELALAPGQRIEAQPSITMRPKHGLKMTLRKRR